MTGTALRLWARLAHAPAIVAAAAMAGAAPAGAAQRAVERADPRTGVSVFWVGHSLVEGKAKSEWGEISLMTLVGRFAEARGLGYRMGDHTLWGCSLSALWRGRPHRYARDAAEMVARREAFEKTADRYDTLVLTESLPVAWAAENEYSAYYLRRFACTMKAANPAARIYLYQSWVKLQGGDPDAKGPPPQRFDWRAEMIAQRKVWEAIADQAARPGVPAPGGWLDRLGWPATGDGGCDSELQVLIVPVGQALVALSDRLAAPRPGDSFALPGGARLTMADMFANPYVNWPRDWPLADDAVTEIDPAAARANLTLRDPSEPHDDNHPSALGIYFVALVHFATLYGQSPVGLPAPPEIGDDLARAIQCVAWEAVVSEPRSGVDGEAEADCGAS